MVGRQFRRQLVGRHAARRRDQHRVEPEHEPRADLGLAEAAAGGAALQAGAERVAGERGKERKRHGPCLPGRDAGNQPQADYRLEWH